MLYIDLIESFKEKFLFDDYCERKNCNKRNGRRNIK